MCLSILSRSRCLVPVCAAVVWLLASAAPADADLNGAQILYEVELPTDEPGVFSPAASQDEQEEFFNLAHCRCDMMDNGQFRVELTPDPPGQADEDQELEIWVGSVCLDDEDRIDPVACQLVRTLEVGTLPEERVEIDVQTLFLPNTDGCTREDGSAIDEFTPVVEVMIRNADSTYTRVTTVELPVDPETPPSMDDATATGADEAVVVSWELPEQRIGDVASFQVLCADLDGNAVLPEGETPPAALYDQSSTLCGVDDEFVVEPAPAGSTLPGGDPLPELPEGLATLNPAFLCGSGGENNGSLTSLRVSGLEVDVAYRIVLLTIDPNRNVTAQDLGVAVPVEAIDFWEDYNNRGGGADGGFCLATSTYGDGSPLTQALRDFRDGTLAQYAWGRAVIDYYYAHVAWMGVYIERYLALRVAAAVLLAPVAAAAALWTYTGLASKLLVVFALALWWHRRRFGALVRRRTLATAAAAAVVLIGSTASAQGYDPYWSNFADPPATAAANQRALWNIGFKLGPYLPAVDAEFDLADGELGPYELFFGGSRVMGTLDVDRFFAFPLGQLGVTGSVGFMTAGGNAFLAADCSAPDAPDPCMPGVTIAVDDEGELVRSPGDETTFRMLPLSLGAVYRFTALDDRFRIPVVPYGKLALAYYVWWISQPSGGVSQTPTPDCPDLDGCDGDIGRGASLGWQGTAGLAIRAERIDPGAALSLKNEYGIDHAGFYVELTYAQVDGFGADDRLAVGDLTWFAGLNFEF